MKRFDEWTDERLQKSMKHSQVETIEISMHVKGGGDANHSRSVTYMMLQGQNSLINILSECNMHNDP